MSYISESEEFMTMNTIKIKARTSNNQIKKQQYLLQRGDLIKLEPGMKVYADIPCMFRGGVFFDTKKDHTDIVIGKVYTCEATSAEKLTKKVFEKIQWTVPVSLEQVASFIESLDLDLSEKTFDASVYAGEYAVLYAASNGGGYCHDGNYPNGWHVYCQKMDDPSVMVDFYQTGCFTAMIRDILPIIP